MNVTRRGGKSGLTVDPPRGKSSSVNVLIPQRSLIATASRLPSIAINPNLQPKLMHLVCHMPNPVRELLRVNNKLLGVVVPPEVNVAPAVVDVDVLVPQVLEPEVDDELRRLEEDGLVDVAPVLVPGAPAEGGEAADAIRARELGGRYGEEARGEEVLGYAHLDVCVRSLDVEWVRSG